MIKIIAWLVVYILFFIHADWKTSNESGTKIDEFLWFGWLFLISTRILQLGLKLNLTTIPICLITIIGTDIIAIGCHLLVLMFKKKKQGRKNDR